MNNYWHSITLGLFNTENYRVSLDFKSLFYDPYKGTLTLAHEYTHNLLFSWTDAGLCTGALFQIIPHAKPENKQLLKEIAQYLAFNQLNVQEGTASLTEMLLLRKKIGPSDTKIYAKENMPNDYYERFSKLFIILDSSTKYRNFYLSKIPELSLNNGYRRKLTEWLNTGKTLSEIKILIEHDTDQPDNRYAKIVDYLNRYGCAILNKDPKNISEIVGIEYHNPDSKEEVKNFQNMLLELSILETRYTIEEINDTPTSIDLVNKITYESVFTNLNIGIADNSEVLLDKADLLHYKDKIVAYFIREIPENYEDRQSAEQLLGKKYEASMVAFTSSGEKYLFPSTMEDVQVAVNEIPHSSLFVKNNLQGINNSKISVFSLTRLPDVVIYSSAQELDIALNMISEKTILKYIYIYTETNSPFGVLFIKDNNSVIHLLASFRKEIIKLIDSHNEILIKGSKDEFIDKKNHFNLATNIWLGLEKEVDWFEQIKVSADTDKKT